MKTIKMADAFGKLAGICAGLEGRYTPAQANLLPSALFAQLTGAQAAAESVTIAERDMRRAVAGRAMAFREAAAIASRLRILLTGNPALTATLADADLPLKKLTGNSFSRKSATTGDQSAAAAAIRPPYARGTDYLSRIGHMEQVVTALQRDPAYKANAADLTVSALSERLEQLKVVQQQYTAATTELKAKRAALKMAFHAPVTGLAATGLAVRRNIRSQFGLNSPEAGAIRGIRFR